MNTNRKTAVITGVIFIIADLAGYPGCAAPTCLDNPDYLTQVSANPNQAALECLLMIIGYLACAGIAVVMYPVLKKRNKGLAIGSVGFRTIEVTLFMVAPRD